jgi:CDP-paratose 2-epimerase
MYRSVLVTGGAGFIGSHLALAMKQRVPTVIALDNLRRRGSEFNLPLLRAAGVSFVHGDVRSAADLVGLDPDLIIECSAEASAQAGYNGSPAYMIDSNLNGCVNCLELARRTGAAFIFLSTSRVYPYQKINALPYHEDLTRFRFQSQNGIDENFTLEGPRSLYGAAKLAAEFLVSEYGEAYSIPFVINRCGLVAGPRQMGKSDQGVMALWMAAHHFQQPLRYIGFGGEGKQVRDVLHISDLVDLILLQSTNLEKYRGGIFNAGGGEANSVSLLECTELCQRITGNQIPIESELETRPADLRIYLTDNSRITSIDGWTPKRTPAQTLTDIHQWIVREEATLRSVFA